MNRIRALREKLGLRQIDVANATGIDQKTLSNYETEKTNPDSYALISLADFFGVSIDYIVGRIDTRFSENERVQLAEKISIIKSELNDIEKFL